MATHSFTTALDGIITFINESYKMQQLGVKFDGGHWNPSRQNDFDAKYKFRIYPFGCKQTDGAGVLDLVHYWAIIGKTNPYENFDKSENEVMDVAMEIVNTLHRRFKDSYTSVFQQLYMFYSSMTVTSDNRRLTVKLNDGEVGTAIFFYSAKATVYALSASAVKPAELQLGVSSTNENGRTWQQEIDLLSEAERDRAEVLTTAGAADIF